MTGPLAGVRVLDLTRLVPGAVATALLADLGADIIKVEAPGAGDYMRTVGPPLPGREFGYRYAMLNRDKRSVVINLKSDRGAALLRQLAAASDVLIENYRPGVMASFGLSYAELQPSCPDLVYCAISGYGQDAAATPAHDVNLMARSGYLSVTGEPPVVPPVPLADFETGERAALAICAALHGPRNGTGGTFLDIAMLDGMVSWMMLAAADYLATGQEPAGDTELRERVPMSAGRAPGYGVYRTLDGRFVALGAVEDRLWARLCEAVGRPDLAVSSLTPAHIERELSAVIATRTLADWMAVFSGSSVAGTPVNPVSATLADPVVRGRGLVRTVQDEKCGPYEVIGWGLGGLEAGGPGQEAPAGAAARVAGADTAAVLAEIGVTGQELVAMRQEGVIG